MRNRFGLAALAVLALAGSAQAQQAKIDDAFTTRFKDEVNVGTPAEGDVLQVVGGKWKNVPSGAAEFPAEPANTVFAGPMSGGAMLPAFRALVAADVPSLDTSKLTSGTLGVARGGTGAATFTAHGVLVGEGTSAFTPVVLATGQVLIGSTGADPVPATLTGTANQVVVTNLPGSITLSTPQSIGTSSTPSFAGITLTGSQTANTVLAAPSGSAGAPTFRALTTLDMSAETLNAVLTNGSTRADATALTIGHSTVATDVLPSYAVFGAQESASTASVNTTGGAAILSAGRGPRSFTVATFGSLSGATAWLWVNGTVVALVEGGPWHATVSNASTASSLAAAINANGTLSPFVTATANSTKVNLKTAAGCWHFEIQSSDQTNLPASWGADGFAIVANGGISGSGTPVLAFQGTTTDSNSGLPISGPAAYLIAEGPGQFAVLSPQDSTAGSPAGTYNRLTVYEGSLNEYNAGTNFNRLQLLCEADFHGVMSAGGDLRVGTQSFFSGNHDIFLRASGTDRWTVKGSGGNFTPVTDNSVQLGDSTHAVKEDFTRKLSINGSTSGTTSFTAGATPTSTVYVLPSADGSSGQVLKTDGSHNLSWTTVTTSTPSWATVLSAGGASTGGTSTTWTDADNLVFGTSTGSKIGTSTSQKLSFWNASPVAQISGSTDVLAGLVTVGLRDASSNPPLNLGTGTFTAGVSAVTTLSITNNVTCSTNGGTISCSNGNIGNEMFGLSTVAAGGNASVFGCLGSGGGSDVCVFGHQATATGNYSIAIGSGASADHGGNRVGGVCIGYTSYLQGDYSIAIGYQAVTTTSHQFNVGDATGYISDVWFGDGVTASSAPHGVTFNISGTTASNGAGVDTTYKSGASKGSGVGGGFLWDVTKPGAGGGGANTYTNVAKIDGYGNVISQASGGANATSATSPFFYLGSCAGVPTGVPTVSVTGAAALVYDSTDLRLYGYSGGAWNNLTPSASATTVQTENGFRLTATSATPVTTSDVANFTTIYCTPYTSSAIWTYDSSVWTRHTSAEFSIALGTLTSGKPYDVFVYNSSGTLTLEFSAAWTSATARSDAIAQQDGVWVKSSDHSRRLLGTFYTTSTTQSQDTAARRLLSNLNNRVARSLVATDTDTSWTYTTATWRSAEGSQTIGVNEVECLNCRDEEMVEVTVEGALSNATPVVATVGLGLDSTSANSAQVLGGAAFATTSMSVAQYRGNVGLGYHQLNWIEQSGASGSTTWYGHNGLIQSGLIGVCHQ